MTRKYFGTDGVRGKVGEYPITPDFVMKLGWPPARCSPRRDQEGADRQGYPYLRLHAGVGTEAGLSAAGLKAILMGPMPTPAVAYLTRTFRAEAGIVISASHNPYYDNGIKFFSADGTKLPMMSSWPSKPSSTTNSNAWSPRSLARRCASMMRPVATSNSARAPSPPI